MTISLPSQLHIGWLQRAYQEGVLSPADVCEVISRRAGLLREKHIWIVPPAPNVFGKFLTMLPLRDYQKYPLWGVPFAIKDNIDLAGVPTTAGCPDYAYIPKCSAETVRRLIAAGGIPVGKTNLDQFATGLVGTRSPYGEVENAWQPELISGGSSSGSAVSVALGMASFALGTDTAGSGRVPAMLNTLIGWKPPLGAWSTNGVVPACASLDCVTAFSLSLEEASMIDAVARGVDDKCAWSRWQMVSREELPQTVFLPAEEPEFYGQWADIYRKKWHQSCDRLRRIMSDVREADTSVFTQAARLLYDGAYVAERWADLGPFVEAHPGSVLPVTEKILRSGGRPELTASQFFCDYHQLAACRQEVNNMLRGSVFVLPTTGGTFTRAEVRADPINTNSQMGRYTNHCNLLDLTAIAVPEAKDDHDHPFGITIFSLAANEHLVRAVARKFMESGN